ADVSKHHAVDPKRVYAIGLSAGGFFAHRLACDASDIFAAVVSQSGATYADASKCKPEGALALVEIHGTKDDTVLYDGGHMSYYDVNADYPSAHDTVAHWAGYLQCAGAIADAGESEDVFAQYKVGVARYTCPRGGVELWTATDGIHAPAYSANFAKTIWSFFAAHPKA
ncbi:MAG TPA: PHB depolymerase family esterase, partial [Labilithrix sp.]